MIGRRRWLGLAATVALAPAIAQAQGPLVVFAAASLKNALDEIAADWARTTGRPAARIRFASPHPRHTGERLIEAIQHLPHVCKHLHLPVQSGSNRILKAMRRRHTREDYLALLDRIRERIPGVTLSTDMIVGFPGETREDFEDTLSLTERAQFISMFSFKYSPRPNTLASKRLPDDVTEEEKTSRIVQLQTLQREIQSRLHQQMVGTHVDVLIDSVSRRRDGELSGRTSGNVVVNFPPPSEGEPSKVGQLRRVRIERAGDRKSTRLNSSHSQQSRMPSSA